MQTTSVVLFSSIFKWAALSLSHQKCKSVKRYKQTIYQVAIVFDYVDDGTNAFSWGNTGAEVIGFASVMYEPEDATAQTSAKLTSSKDVSESY